MEMKLLTLKVKNYDQPVQSMIYHTYRQMKSFCKIDKIEVSSIFIEVQEEILKNEENMWKMENNYNEYLGILQSHSWRRIYEKKIITVE